MDKLVNATLPFRLIPPVVPEFPGIIVGGAYAGTAGESSSFKHGLFDATVERIEISLSHLTIHISHVISSHHPGCKKPDLQALRRCP